MTLDMAVPRAPFDMLPTEIIREILTYLNHRELLRTSAVARLLHVLCKDPNQWRRLCEQNGLIVKLRLGVYTCPKLIRPETTIPTSLSQHSPNPVRCNWYQHFKHTWKLSQNWQTLRCRKFQLPRSAYAHEGHTDDIYALQTQGKYLVSGSLDKTIRIWDLDTHRLASEPLRGHQEEVICLQFDAHRDTNAIVSGGSRGELISWRFSPPGMLRRIVKAHDGSITGLKFDRTLLVTASVDTKIKVWSLSTIRLKALEQISSDTIAPLNVLTGHDGPINAIDFSGDTIVSGAADGTMKIWSIEHGVCLKSVEEPRSIACVYFNERTIISGGRNNSITIYDRHLRAWAFLPHNAMVRTVTAMLDVSSTGIIITGDQDGSILVWRSAGHGQWRSVRFDPIIQSATWNANTSTGHSLLTQRRRILSLHSDGQRLACCPESSNIVGWDFT
ncbi:WD40-repeat-containing domain protein [Neohortaea acidophila]|uniref:WD40-repeat-containing domain protein n=1 Tax=Neohortaea acidophila TaxID=245834 RepID=A0A6A6PEQ6_9PEZI|nr:WD40-repeat-containing domain protein [Neohortaea acidophila]KAF2478458.1 WD40-repeat-containing domain protein [Neohortaea acidophila]